MIQSSSGPPWCKDSDGKIQVWTDNADGESTVRYNRENTNKNQSPWHRQLRGQQRKKLPHFLQVPAVEFSISREAHMNML